MFHKKLHGDLESDFSKEIDEQNSQRNVGNYRNIPKTQKPKKLILISEDELEHQKFNNSQQNIHKDSNYQAFLPDLPNLSQNNYQNPREFQNSRPNQSANLDKNYFQNSNQNPDFTGGFDSEVNSNSGSNFGEFQKNKFNKNKNSLNKTNNKTKKNSLGKIILALLLVICVVFGGFWFWQTDLEKSRAVNKNCLEKLEQNKDLELSLNCQNIDESWQSFWKNTNLESNYKENQDKIETMKKNLQTKIDQINLKIDQNLDAIDKLKIPNSVLKPIFDFNSQQIVTNNSQNNSTNSNSQTNSSILQTSSSKNSQSLSSSQSNLPLTQTSQNPTSNSSFSPLSNSSFSTQILANSNTNTNSSFISNSFSNSQNSTQNSIQSTAPKSKNLKSELVQKTKYWQDLENLLKNNLEQKVAILDKIISENGDLEKELNLADLRTFLTNFKSEVGIIGSSNTDIVPQIKISEAKNDVDWFVKTRQIEDKNTEILKKIEIENTKNPDKSRQRLLKLYKKFTGEQFKNLYNNQNLSKTLEKSKEISILGDPVADNYIIKLAEKRGYQKRAQADETKLEEIDGQKLQTEAKKAYQELKIEAKKEGLEMVMVSGYRSNSEQKQIFIERLGNLATILSIKSGKSDVVLDKLLQTTSIPGYSRHHTGYTFDLGCNSTELTVFKDTKCYEWLSRDNYLNAKRFGLVPSYPEGGGEQGPDPEAWEYVWVGEDSLKN